jgi:hypothetical protein
MDAPAFVLPAPGPSTDSGWHIEGQAKSKENYFHHIRVFMPVNNFLSREHRKCRICTCVFQLIGFIELLRVTRASPRRNRGLLAGPTGVRGFMRRDWPGDPGRGECRQDDNASAARSARRLDGTGREKAAKRENLKDRSANTSRARSAG